MINGRNKFGIGKSHECQQGWRFKRENDTSATGQEGMLFDLGHQALVSRFLGIRVQQPVQLGRGRQKARPEPQKNHEAGGGAFPCARLLFGCRPELHVNSL